MQLGGSIMFPAAGHMALAIEGAMQHCEVSKIDVHGMTLRHVDLKTALIIPETDAGVEIQLRLSQTSESLEAAPSYSFAVESYAAGIWTVHSEGSVIPVTPTHGSLAHFTHPVTPDVLSQRHTGKRWNDTFRRVGFEYGPSFSSLNNIRTHEKYHQATGEIPMRTTSISMTGESRYLLHPSTVDCLLQLVIISIHAGLYQEMPWGVVPINFEEVTFFPPGEDADVVGQAVAWNNVRGDRARYFNTSAQLATPAGKVVLDVRGLQCVAYEAALPLRSETKKKSLPYTRVVWKPDLAIYPLEEALWAYTKTKSAVNAVLEVVDLLSHKQPLSSVLVLDSSEDIRISQILQSLPTTADLHFAQSVSDTAEDSPSAEDGRVKRFALPKGTLDLKTLNLESQDLIIIGRKDASFLIDPESWSSLSPLIGAKGKAIILLSNDDLPQTRENVQKSGFSSIEIAFRDQTLVVCSVAQNTNGYAQEPDIVNLVYSRRHSAAPRALADAMADQGLSVQMKEIEEVDLVTDKQIFFYDPSASCLARPELASFEALKEIICSGRSVLWLTAGVNEGKCASGAMAQGFLRVAREEQKMSKLSLLDVDKSETFGSIAKTVATILASSTHTASPAEHEYWLHNGICNVSRVLFNEKLNDRMITNDESAQEMPLPSQGLLRAVFDNSNIAFRQSDEFEMLPIGLAEVEIQVECLEVFKQDSRAEFEGPRLLSGVILNVGGAVKTLLRGMTVITYASNPYDTVVRVAEGMCVECEPSAAKALVYAVPDLCRAINAMQCTTGLVDKPHVLLLPTSEYVTRCFARLSETQGFRLTIVRDRRADSETKMEGAYIKVGSALDTSEISQIHRLIDEADSPIAIIAEDFSPFSQEIWRKIPSCGCFVIYGNKQKGISVAPDLGPFKRDARFCVTSIATIFEKNSKSLGKILQMAVSTIKDQESSFVSIPSAVGIKTIEKASEDATVRSVLAYNYGHDIVKV